jgi:hypothetical protein
MRLIYEIFDIEKTFFRMNKSEFVIMKLPRRPQGGLLAMTYKNLIPNSAGTSPAAARGGDTFWSAQACLCFYKR